jgi:DNA repair exonuclease SbcCD nuclease subunit
MKLIHSADWQLGASFTTFGEHAEKLRHARLATLRHALDIARERAVDAFLIV